MRKPTQKIRAAIRREAEMEMKRVSADILAQAKREVPVDEGTLRRSALRKVEWDGDTLKASISFNTPYAAKQHEDASLTHNGVGFYGRQRQGKAKYLEDPVKQYYPKVKQRLADAMRRATT